MKVAKMIRSRVAQIGAISTLVAISGSVFSDPAPLQLAALSEGFEAERVYMQSCFACHSSGAAGAPKVGDAAAWTPRLEKGMDAVVANAINGLNGVMPAKGLCFTCTDDDLRALVQYMVDNSR